MVGANEDTGAGFNSSGKVVVLEQWIPHIYVGDPAPPPRPTPRGQLHSKLGEGGGDDCGILKQ